VAQANPANQASIVTPTEVSHSLTVHSGLRRTADFPGNEIAMRSKLGPKAVVPAGKSARAPHMQPPTAQAEPVPARSQKSRSRLVKRIRSAKPGKPKRYVHKCTQSGRMRSRPPRDLHSVQLETK
jgi:hypothetical protein